MNSPTLNQIEQSIILLSYEEQLWLVERIIHNLRVFNTNNNLNTKPHSFDEQLSLIAIDPDIQTQLQTIQGEFVITEMDGLNEL